MLPLAIFAWVAWQQLLARIFYGGVFQAGLTWVEGTAEAVFVLVAALVAPARKRVAAAVSLGFFILRDIATVAFSAGIVRPSDAVVAIALAAMATAIVWRYAR